MLQTSLWKQEVITDPECDTDQTCAPDLAVNRPPGWTATQATTTRGSHTRCCTDTSLSCEGVQTWVVAIKTPGAQEQNPWLQSPVFVEAMEPTEQHR